MTSSDRPRPESPADPVVGTVLAGRYRIVRRLGEGAMGAVYLGEHMRFGRLDAIKVLREEMARDSEATERFLRGARNVSAINHPNVCTVYDFGDTEDGRQFLAMEFVEGETLADILEREGRLPLERAVDIVEQIARALDAAHDTGIVHRDLKPGNVMVARARGGGDLVKVVDFDIAKGTAEGAGAEVTRTGFVVGTPEYMSPEQLIGDPLDHRSDVYSLAVVFVRILTGALPVRATRTQDLMVERLTREPLPLAEIAPELDVPTGLQGALARGLERRREDRPDSAGALAEDLRRAAEGGGAAPVAPAPPSAGTPPPDRPSDSTVPPTEVGRPPGTHEVRAARGSSPGGRGPLPWIAAGGIAVVAVLVGLLILGGDEAPTGSAASPRPSAAAGDRRSAGDPADPGLRDSAPGAAAADSAGDARNRREPVPGDDPAPGRPETTPDRPTPRERETAPETVGAEPSTAPVEGSGGALSAAAADALLERQLDLVNGDEVADWVLAGDSARLLFEQRPRLPADLRARASWVAAQAYLKRGLRDDARDWARRAVELAPDDPALRTFLDLIGGAP